MLLLSLPCPALSCQEILCCPATLVVAMSLFFHCAPDYRRFLCLSLAVLAGRSAFFALSKMVLKESKKNEKKFAANCELFLQLVWRSNPHGLVS